MGRFGQLRVRFVAAAGGRKWGDGTEDPDWAPESEEDYEVARAELKKRFAEWLGVVGIESQGTPGRRRSTTSGPMSTDI